MIEIKTRVCTKCKEEKYETDFHDHPTGLGGLSSQCKACHSECQRKGREKRKAKYAGVNVYNGEEKTCIKCLGVFPKEKKYWLEDANGPGGLNSYCRVCNKRLTMGYKDSGDIVTDIVSRVVKKWSKERAHKRNKKENATAWIEHSEGDFRAMLIEQRGLCAVSGLRLTPENVSVDHIIPVSKGGTHDMSNLRLVVWSVNEAMGTREDAEFIHLCIRVADYQWSQLW
jgi:5-methylcytosine-specific restriction endonuclease McrA